MSFNGAIALGLIGSAPQYQQAIDAVKNLEQKHGRIDRFVGHSLGGGLASAAAIVYNRPATTFNAAGLSPLFAARFNANWGAATRLIDAYRVQGDILSTLQDASPLWAVHATPGMAMVGLLGLGMPNSVGKTLWLPGEGMSMIARHLMDQVLLGMRKMS